ncbi:MAG: aspartate aminotransferase family protein [Pirellulaceae bacterium]
MAIADKTYVKHPGEDKSNAFRERTAHCEPLALRTFTPSMLVISRSEGSYHWTSDGRKLADFTSGVLVSNLGHNPTRWWRRVTDLMQLGGLSDAGEFCSAVPLTAYNAVTEIEVQACERLIANMRSQPGGGRMEQVLWAASGSEAIQKALWACLARNRKRDIILATRFGFHGKKGLAGAVTGSEQDRERDPRVKFIAFPREECCDIERRSQPIDLEPYRLELERISEQLGDRICCLITEPYLGGGGSYHPQLEYMQLLQQFCREHHVPFILDEIQANFGRTGPMYAYTHYGVEPDIVCLGKGLGNGIPVSAAVGRADIFDSLHYGEGSDTWSANPLACAAVIATLEEFEATRAIERGMELSKLLETSLVKLKQTGCVAHVRGEGCVWGVECKGIGRNEPEEVAIACVEACYRGDAQGRAIHLLGPLAGKVIRVSPPLVMPLDEAQSYLDAMYSIFSAVRLKLR